MKKCANMHSVDRAMRLVIGVICLYVGFVGSSLITSKPVAILVGVFGVVNVWAFMTSRCPVYTVAGFSTAGKTEAQPGQ